MANKSVKGTELRLLAVALLADAESVVLTSEENATRPIELPTHGLSDPLQAPGRAFEITTPTTSDQAGRTLSKVALPEAGKRFLLLLVPSKQTYVCHVVRLDDPGFKAGNVCFLNVSQIPVAGSLGPRKFVAKSGKPEIVAAPQKGELPYYQVQFYYKQGEQTRALADTRWPHDDRSRAYVFFFTNPKTGRLTYRAVDEDLPPES